MSKHGILTKITNSVPFNSRNVIHDHIYKSPASLILPDCSRLAGRLLDFVQLSQLVLLLGSQAVGVAQTDRHDDAAGALGQRHVVLVVVVT